jgi:hypothetical protein
MLRQQRLTRNRPRSEDTMKLTQYESDATQFIRDFLAKNPEVVEKQKVARATWWDKPQTLEEQRRAQESRVPQHGYVYYYNP